MANEFIARKGLIVSGSSQLTGSLNVSRGITGSLFGTSSWANSASYVLPSGLPTGTVSSSVQVSYTGLSNIPANIVSSSAQVKTLLPAGTVSSSVQINTGSFSGSITSASFASVSPANTLTGTTLAANVVNSSLTSVGTLTGLTVNGNARITGSLDVTGAFTAQTKSFKIAHQQQIGKSLVYGVLESHEHGVYTRGKLTNNNTIILPEEWSWLVDEDSITVQLTPIGNHQKLYVKEITDTHIIIGNNNIFNNINCFYIIHATRKDVSPLITVI